MATISWRFLKCYYDQILDTQFFSVFVHNKSFLGMLPNFNLLRTLELAVLGPLFPENLRPPLIFLVPSLAREFEKMTSFSQKYHTG